ncbi:putative toxin-antitoxin system toxin component, PIN family [Flavobacteriaceae bacterium F89]|uniref:Toxin-antitoxin system toxin component, PIN family n=1 Tax=Cerina litoralis TaxID=2874477 RepID=A0AAE3ESD6_9FLAO|nr:putative toxin-antitoxin system toxin component, PIN family [Cerina litoralis]MCG2460088.1 putative toxin-antitoxin system toxin component, PIN family [Cerina litoralis]
MTKLFVFDTNSLISAAILPDSVSGRAFFSAVEKGLLLISEETLEELKSVISRKKFDKYLPKRSDRSVFIDSLWAASLKVAPNISITDCRDPKDNKFLELAVSA